MRVQQAQHNKRRRRQVGYRALAGFVRLCRRTLSSCEAGAAPAAGGASQEVQAVEAADAACAAAALAGNLHDGQPTIHAGPAASNCGLLLLLLAVSTAEQRARDWGGHPGGRGWEEGHVLTIIQQHGLWNLDGRWPLCVTQQQGISALLCLGWDSHVNLCCCSSSSSTRAGIVYHRRGKKRHLRSHHDLKGLLPPRHHQKIQNQPVSRAS